MWWENLFFGFWNGLTGWVVLIVHAFGGWDQFPFYDMARSGNWYDFGFLIGVGAAAGGAGSSGRVGRAKPRKTEPEAIAYER